MVQGKIDSRLIQVSGSALSAMASVAQASLVLRTWETENLPVNGSHLGFETFMRVILEVAHTNHQGAMLKNLYLGTSFSEKGLRLHIRRLESEGWICIKRSDIDFRSSRVELTKKSWELLRRYSESINLFVVAVVPVLATLHNLDVN